MKRFLTIVVFALFALCCTHELEYDLSDTPTAIVINAIWSTAESEHLVYLAESDAYRISCVKDTADMQCYINGRLSSKADSVWAVTSRDGMQMQCYRIKADAQPGDSVRLAVSLPGHDLKAATVVPPLPEVRIDSVSVRTDPYSTTIPYRLYHFTCTINDIPNHDSYYRLYHPSIQAEAWLQRADSLVATKDWPYGLEIDENEPIFKNTAFYFPEQLSDNMTFVHSGLSNATHVFSDEPFSNGSYSFSFDMNTRQYSAIPGNFNLIKYKVLFRVSSLREEEYLYLLAYNAARVSNTDILSEPVSLPSNVEGGLGTFAFESTFEVSLQLKDCVYPPNINGEEPPL